MPLPVRPDLVELVRLALLAQTAVTGLVSTRIYDRIPATPVWPLIVVTTVDEGEGGEPWRGDARTQLDCWGAGGSPAQTAATALLARTVWSVARDLKGTYAAGKIDMSAPLLMLAQPDADTGRARTIVDLNIHCST